jgi:hypothetical protein
MRYTGYTKLSDRTRESLVRIAREALKTRCHDGTSLAWVLRGLTESGALVWDDKPARRQTYRNIARDVLLYMERQGLLVRDYGGWWWDYRAMGGRAMTARPRPQTKMVAYQPKDLIP